MRAEYISHMGNDLQVVNAARVSFDKESEWEWEAAEDEHGAYEYQALGDKDKSLISYLARHNHWTPFSHATITLRETVPIFVARQRFKHMVGFTYNEVSRRYVSDEPEFFIPIWRSKSKNKKQGSDGPLMFVDDPLAEGSDVYFFQEDASSILEDVHAFCLESYNRLLLEGVAPEQARMVLPQSMYTSFYATGSLYAFARAYKLRSHEHAQAEIRELAEGWNSIIRPLYPVSWAALVDG